MNETDDEYSTCCAGVSAGAVDILGWEVKEGFLELSLGEKGGIWKCA